MGISKQSLTSVYVLEAGHAKSANRYTTIKSTGDYEPLERLSNSKCPVPWLYVTNIPDRWSGEAHKRPCTLNTGKANISGLTFPNVVKYPSVAYGDIQGTEDAVLVVFSECRTRINVLVFAGCRLVASELWRSYISGELIEEMDMMRPRLRATEYYRADAEGIAKGGNAYPPRPELRPLTGA